MRALLVVTLLFGLYACANVAYVHDANLEDVDYWAQKQHYSKALSILDQLEPQAYEKGVLAEKRASLKQGIQVLENETLAQVEHLVSGRQAMKAIELLNDALYRIPDSQRLIQKRKQIISDREARRRDLQKHVFFKSAKSHLGSQKEYKQLAEQYKDDQQSRDLLRQSRRQAVELNTSLIELAKYYVQQERYSQARQTLLMANQLLPDPKTQAMLNSVDRAIQDARRAGGKRAVAYRDAESELVSGDLLKARMAVNQYVAAYPGTLQAKSLDRRLQAKIDAAVEAGLERGRHEYQQRNIQKALEIWRPLLKLRPGHAEVEANIERAQRVLNKLEKLTSEIDSK